MRGRALFGCLYWLFKQRNDGRWVETFNYQPYAQEDLKLKEVEKPRAKDNESVEFAYEARKAQTNPGPAGFVSD